MSHSTWIALSLAALFLVYITMRGHLPDYLATVLGPFPAKETGSEPGSAGGGPDATAGDILKGIDKGTEIPGMGDIVTGIRKWIPSWLGGEP